MTERIAFLTALAAVLALFPSLKAQQPPTGIRWDFNETSTKTAHDSTGNLDDPIEGLTWKVPGIEGNGLLFDGYTTRITRAADKVPQLKGGFTVSAWVALNYYPWNWVPIADQNAETLSFPDRFFDAYTIAFGIRNVTRIDLALSEAHRVLKFGGRFFCLEFSATEWPGFKEAYDLYSHRLVPRLGQAIAGDAESYRYLIESIRRFPPMREFETMIRTAGFAKTKVEPLLGGLVAIHSGWKV